MEVFASDRPLFHSKKKKNALIDLCLYAEKVKEHFESFNCTADIYIQVYSLQHFILSSFKEYHKTHLNL